jgi:hypothetical protein
MFEFDKLFEIRKNIIEESVYESAFSEQSILETILPDLETAKVIETTEINHTHFLQEGLKINGYDINSTGERLILFVLNSGTINLNEAIDNLCISTREYYDAVFKMSSSFLSKCIKKHISPPSDKVGFLISNLRSAEFIDQIDVVEIIQVSLTASIDKRGPSISLRTYDFQDEVVSVKYTISNAQKSKGIILKKKLIDLNFLKDVLVDQKSLTRLVVDFSKYTDGKGLKALEAVRTSNFISYLAVIPATIIADLYKNESTKLLENNVRSFLSFKKDANSGMQRTIRKEPEKFIAYNNGLTITASDVEVKNIDGYSLISKLIDFQIVNGGQTTATIYFTSKENVDISKVFLMAKINVLISSNTEFQIEKTDVIDFISDISLYSNTQSKVDSVDFTSRSEEVKQIKRLSTNINPPTRDRWFFELMKGEFNTLIAFERNDNRKKKLRELYKGRVLDIKSVAKFYGAWGDIPYLVKLGGVKFTGLFLNNLKNIGAAELDRTFYEDVIAKCILWNSFQTIYGSGKNSIGQLRAAVIPYSMAAIFINTDAVRSKPNFNFTKIWIEQKVSEQFEVWARDLMILMNDLIKKYSHSDNVEDGTKRKEVWDRIRKSPELELFFELPSTKKNLGLYERDNITLKSTKEVDFSDLVLKVEILDNGRNFYKKVKSEIVDKFELGLSQKYSRIVESLYLKNKTVFVPQEIRISDAKLLKEMLIYLNNKYSFESIEESEVGGLSYSLKRIIEVYNDCLLEGKDLVSEFSKYAELSEKKRVLYASAALRKVGASLKKSVLPSIEDIHYISNYFKQS